MSTRIAFLYKIVLIYLPVLSFLQLSDNVQGLLGEVIRGCGKQSTVTQI